MNIETVIKIGDGKFSIKKTENDHGVSWQLYFGESYTSISPSDLRKILNTINAIGVEGPAEKKIDTIDIQPTPVRTWIYNNPGRRKER